jgi:hypothetical protein
MFDGKNRGIKSHETVPLMTALCHTAAAHFFSIFDLENVHETLLKPYPRWNL